MRNNGGRSFCLKTINDGDPVDFSARNVNYLHHASVLGLLSSPNARCKIAFVILPTKTAATMTGLWPGLVSACAARPAGVALRTKLASVGFADPMVHDAGADVLSCHLCED